MPFFQCLLLKASPSGVTRKGYIPFRNTIRASVDRHHSGKVTQRQRYPLVGCRAESEGRVDLLTPFFFRVVALQGTTQLFHPKELYLFPLHHTCLCRQAPQRRGHAGPALTLGWVEEGKWLTSANTFRPFFRVLQGTTQLFHPKELYLFPLHHTCLCQRAPQRRGHRS